jgi:predicted HTH transcriptional regulator
MFIEEIMADTQMEDYQTEFKGKLNREDVVGWLKTIAGFANADGGDMWSYVKI